MAVKEGFKVVRIKGKHLYSALHSNYLMYRRRGKTFPPLNGGPLCVFKNEIDAQDFKNHELPPLVVYAVRYEPSRARRVWRVRGRKHDIAQISALSHGKVLAKWVELVKEIQ